MAEQSKRDQFIERIKQGIDELNEEIDRLEQRADDLKKESRDKLEQRREDIRQRRDELEKRLTEVRAASEAGFDKLKLEAEHAWKAFDNSVKYFRSHFK